MKRMSGKGSRDRIKKPRFKSANEDGMPVMIRKRFCRFCKDKVEYIDYKDLHILEKLIGERGKISSRRSTGTCARHQRVVAAAVKRSRFLSLIPYIR
jgi:small subunit ribosomal protein S18